MQEMIFQASQGYPMPECLCYNTADLRMLTEFYAVQLPEHHPEQLPPGNCRSHRQDQYGGDAPHLAVGPVH